MKKQPQQSPPKISVVILNWNGRDDTLECLESVSKINYPNFEAIVVDNGSSDDSASAIRGAFPRVHLIETGVNLGFAGGNNVGIQAAMSMSSDYVFILNNDTIVDKEILDGLVKAAHIYPKAGILGPKIFYFGEKNKIWNAGGYWDDKKLRFEERGFKEEDNGKYEKDESVDWIVGCAMFIPARVIRRIGLLDSDFFLNNEEIDYCSRVKKAGYDCVFVPKAKLWHKVSASFGGENSPLKEYFTSRNRLLWAKKNASAVLKARIHLDATRILIKNTLRPYWRLLAPSSLSLKRKWWRFVEETNDPVKLAYSHGFRDYWRGRFGDCPTVVRDLTGTWADNRTKN